VEYSPGRGYGVSLVSRQWIDGVMGDDPGLTQILFQEKGYDNHQDVFAYLNANILVQGRSGL
jgi:hypothetical protein